MVSSNSSACKTVCGGTVAAALILSLLNTPTLSAPISGKVSKTDRDPTILLYFRAVIDSDLSTAEMCTGDSIDAHLAEDLKSGNDTIAKAGAKIVGHIDSFETGHNIVAGMVKRDKRQRHPKLNIKLDKIILADKKELLIDGTPTKQQSIFGVDGRFKEIDVDEDGAVVKATSLDMYGSPDFAMVVPESLLQIGKRNQLHIEEGDQLDFRAEVAPEELAAVTHPHASLQVHGIAHTRLQEEAGRSDDVTR